MRSSLRLAYPHPRFEARDDSRLMPLKSWNFRNDLLAHHKRNPQIDRLADPFTRKASWGHTDDVVADAIQRKGASHHVSGARESAFPIVVAEHCHRMTARRTIIVRIQTAAQQGIDAERREIVAGNQSDPHLPGLWNDCPAFLCARVNSQVGAFNLPACCDVGKDLTQFAEFYKRGVIESRIWTHRRIIPRPYYNQL